MNASTAIRFRASSSGEREPASDPGLDGGGGARSCWSDPLWHVAYTAPRAEFSAGMDIANELGFGVFQPLEQNWEVRRGLRVKVAKPLFPRYVFVLVDHCRQDWQKILEVDDVVDVLMSGDGVPGHVPAASIEALQKAEAVGIFDRTTRFPNDFDIGETVRISDGQFSGHNGIIAEFTARMRSATACKRAKLLVEFMGRMITLDAPVTSLEKL